MRSIVLTVLGFLMTTAVVAGDSPPTGPVIEGYGPVFAVPEDSYNLVPGVKYKISWDIGNGPDDPAATNRSIESVARFLNMSERYGIDPGDLELALVLHGSGTHSALHDEAYTERFGMPNGSGTLIRLLREKGVQMYLCGQSAAYNGYGPEDLRPEITMAVSAMTAHARLQHEGYVIMPF